jgi:hypothetical protein
VGNTGHKAWLKTGKPIQTAGCRIMIISRRHLLRYGAGR